jgi:hypothetical protein
MAPEDAQHMRWRCWVWHPGDAAVAPLATQSALMQERPKHVQKKKWLQVKPSARPGGKGSKGKERAMRS